MGLAVLTAVFGMGTGVTPPVWSPEMYPAGGQAGRALGFPSWSHSKQHPILRMSGSCSTPVCQNCLCGVTRRSMVDCGLWPFDGNRGVQRPDRGGQAAWLLGPVG
jgi:hypothetical protein